MNEQTPETRYSSAMINVQGEPQEAWEVYADDTREQTIAFVFDEVTLAQVLALPDLLAACEKLCDAIEYCGLKHTVTNSYLLARAAIARAKGE